MTHDYQWSIGVEKAFKVLSAPSSATAPQHEPSAAHQSRLMLPSPSELLSRTPSNLASSSHCAPEVTADAESSQSQPSAPSPPVPLPEPQPDQDFSSTPEISGDGAASQSDLPVPLPEPQSDQGPSSSSTLAPATGDSSPESQPTSLSQAAPVASSTPHPPPEPEADPASSGQTMLEHLLRPDQHYLPRLHRWHALHLSQHSSCLSPPRALLSAYFAMRSPNFPLRLSALRQAFTLVLSDSHHAKYISIAGRVILGGLAARNARELPAFQEAYARLVAFAEDASHREAICTELAQIQHFNFLDIVFELVLLGVLQGARPLIYPTPGGFLEHVVDMICSFSPPSMQRRPRAEQYLFLLQDAPTTDATTTLFLLSMLLLEEIFGREEHCYTDPGSLVLCLWDCLQTHVQHLLAKLQGVIERTPVQMCLQDLFVLSSLDHPV
ncbi:hypothetical protein AOLI_G00143990 [Acnodon oligacanthus]